MDAYSNRRLLDLPFEGGTLVRVTVTVGATPATPRDTSETVGKRADRLLSLAKAAGRNRISIGRDA